MTRILMHRTVAERLAQRISRRDFLATGGTIALAPSLVAALSACSGEKANTSTGALNRTLNLYTWAEYDDPDVLRSWGDVRITVFSSNEEAAQKLAATRGTSGFDIVCPDGIGIPQLAKDGLLQPLDLSRIPNFSHLDPRYTNQGWDPGNQYSVCKNWGTTGWLYDTTVIKTPITTWADFTRAAQTVASGATSVVDSPTSLAGIYFWANGIDWTTESATDLDACERFLVNDLAPHIKAFDSFAGINLTSGNYVLSQVFNGDARQGLIAVKDAGGDPGRYAFGVGAPATELFMDNWCIASGAEHTDAAYDFLNFMLEPEQSAKEIAYHGFHTGLRDIEQRVPASVDFRDMIFFAPDVVARMKVGARNRAHDRLVSIANTMKAKAGR
jgi:spermidine/putrescine transport system substrate-binding protein